MSELFAGQYERLSLLGEGAFGKVWRVRDNATDRELALKEIKAVEGDDRSAADVAQQVEQEYISLAKLKHPNIVEVFDYGILENQSRYLVMELVPGRDLSEIIAEGPMELEDACRVLISLCQALDLMHSRLFVHCDIKAENVRITDDNDVRLMDFGLLHQLGIASEQARGTVQYMAPEVFTGGVIDQRTDLYSVGVLAFELLTGQLPYSGANHAEVLRKHLQAPIPEPSDLIDLPEEIDALIKRLLAKAPADRLSNASELIGELASIAGIDVEHDPTHRTSYLYSAELIGRDEESGFLDGVREGLARRQGASVFVAGRAGEGKSRLLAEFSLKTRLEGHIWTVGRCQKEGLGPLQPMAEGLGPLIGRTPEALLDEHGPVLSSLLPQLRARFTPPSFASPAQAKLRQHEAVSAWMEGVAEEQPFVLCVEDLHWADGGTLELLNHLIRTLTEAPLVLIATFRSDEVERTSPIYATVDEGLTVNLQLRPLRRRHIGQLLTSTLAKHEVPGEFAKQLFETTGGNAFFTVETLRYLVESGLLERPEDSWRLSADDVQLPSTIAEVVHHRLGVLPDDLRAICRAISPIGLALDAKLMQATTALQSAALIEQLELLVGRQFVHRASGHYHFTHQTVRDAVYDELGVDERARLHNVLGEVMERERKDDPSIEPSQLAYHFNLGRDEGRAIKYFLEAGTKAARNMQPFDATRYLKAGAELVEGSTLKDKEAQLLQFLNPLVNTAMTGHPPTCAATVDRLWEIWGKKVDPAKHVEKIRAGKGGGGFIGGLLAKVKKAPAGGAFDPTTGDVNAIYKRMLEVKGAQCMALAAMGEPERSLEVGERTIAMLPSERALPRGAILNARCIALTHLGRYNEIIAAADEASSIFDEAEQVPNALSFAWCIAHYFTALGRSLKGMPVGRPQIQRACDIAEERFVLDAKGFALWAAHCHYTLAGKPDGFEELLTEIQALLRRLGYPYLLDSRATTILPIYYIDRGQFELAQASMDKLERLGKSGDSWILTYSYVYRGLVSMEQGDLESARSELERATELARERRLGRVNTALCGLGQVMTEQGERDGARAALDEVLERSTSEAFECYHDEIVARRLLAGVSEETEARAHLDRAIELAARSEMPVQEGMAWYTLGKLEKANGGDPAAAFTKAADLFTEIRNDFWLERLAKARG